ncbi:hypothetical protein KAU43_07655 [candidate division WOR-3 bacterium]|nr:hypothetical protein [candidate division WOR-3 bacterium]
MVWKRCAELGYEVFEQKGNEKLKKALDYARWLWYNDYISDTIANAIDVKISKEAKKTIVKDDKESKKSKDEFEKLETEEKPKEKKPKEEK